MRRWSKDHPVVRGGGARVRSAEVHYGIENLTARANHWIEQWSEVCNENQRLLNQIERDTALLRQALEALEEARDALYEGHPVRMNTQKAIAALRERLGKKV